VQVFKLFFQLLKANRRQMIIYVAMYIGILFGIIIPMRGEGSGTQYLDQKSKYALMDEDNSELSKGFADSLDALHKKVAVSSFDKEALQDELYASNINSAVVIKKGFEEAFLRGEAEKYLVIYNIPTENKAKLFVNDVNEYLRYISGYVKAGYTVPEAVKATDKIVNEKADVTILADKDISQESVIQLFYNYLAWILVLMITTVVAPILIVLNKKEVRNRIECSSFPFAKTNGQILLGAAVAGIGLTVLFTIAAKLYFGASFSGIKVLLMSANLLCYAVLALSIAFMVSKLTGSEMVINMIANVISLGMSFFCGVFVPFYLLAEGVQNIARFMPAYWYIQAISEIDRYSGDSLPKILQCMGIELLFAAVIIVIGLAVGSARRESVANA